jgi:DNA modification methylase
MTDAAMVMEAVTPSGQDGRADGGSGRGRGMKPYYDDGKGIVIYHARCEDVLASLPDGSIDLVVTSPPYNLGLSPGGNGKGTYAPGKSSKGWKFAAGYGEHRDAMPQADYDAWQRAVIAECWRVLAGDGAIFYNHKPRIEHKRLRLPLDLDFGVPLRQIITWDRAAGIGLGKGHFCSVYEWILVLAKPDFTLADFSASAFGDVWRLGIEHKDFGHPCPFPESLARRAIASTNAASVLDPFMGSGSTIAAAKALGRGAVGCDVEERYCEIAARRLEQSVLDLGGAA